MSAGPLFAGPSLDFNMALPRQLNIGEDVRQDLRQARREIELLKTMDPYRAAEMSLDIQMERMRVAEAMYARDTVVKRLVDAHISIRQKVAIINRLEEEKAELQRRLSDPKGLCIEDDDPEKSKSELEIERLQRVIESLRDDSEVRSLKEFRSERRRPLGDPPPSYEADSVKMSPSFQKDVEKAATGERAEPSRIPFRVLRQNSTISFDSFQSNASNANPTSFPVSPFSRTRNPSGDPEHMMSVRHAILAALPIPLEIPMDDALSPINIPPPFTLHEFLGTTTGSLKNSLSNYRIFHQLTTSWCPQREEHGYMLTPVYKCSTNPRVATAHRWSAVDPIAKMNKPTECFYNKDGKWYYAGIYKAFRLEDLSGKEWEALSDETSQLLVKETIAARKNTSPQNHYETAQLYAAGALKVACVGLQCVGFNNALYRTICTQSGKWNTKMATNVNMEPTTSSASVSTSASGSELGLMGCVAGGRGENGEGRRNAEVNENIPAGPG